MNGDAKMCLNLPHLDIASAMRFLISYRCRPSAANRVPRYLKVSRGNTAHNPKNVGTSSHNLLQKCSHTQNVLMRGFRGQVMGRVVVGAT